MNKEPIKEQTFVEKAKDSFFTALMSAGIVLVVLLLIWLPLKILPVIYGNGTNFVATTLSSTFIPATTTSTTSGTATNNNIPANSKDSTIYYFGKSDLQVTLIATGIIDPASKQFTQTNYAGFNDEIAMKFEVKNIGTNVSGSWKLRINTPSRTTPYYDSPDQSSIKPGDRIIYTTSFDNPTTLGINTAYITADPLNNVNEISESNNQIIVPINIQGTYYTYNNGYNYGSNTPTPNLPYGSLYTWTNINVNCYANPQTSYVGSPVTWYTTVSGGNGYYTYSWTGSDYLYSNNSAVSQVYYSSGTKMATVVVTSNGASVTRQCSAYIY
jgi:hypothetical protein